MKLIDNIGYELVIGMKNHIFFVLCKLKKVRRYMNLNDGINNLAYIGSHNKREKKAYNSIQIEREDRKKDI